MSESEKIRLKRPFETDKIYEGIVQGSLRLKGLNDAGAAYLIAESAKKNHRLLVISPDVSVSERMKMNVSFFAPELSDRMATVDDFEQSPYLGTDTDGVRMAEKYGVLSRILSRKTRVTFISVNTLSRRVMPAEDFEEASFTLSSGTEIEPEILRQKLVALGYVPESEVKNPGTFAMRGGIFDLYSPAAPYPARIEFYGDFVDTMRYFEPESQKTVSATDEVHICPCDEILYDDKHFETFRSEMRRLADSQNAPTKIVNDLLGKTEKNARIWGIHALFPAFFERVASILSYFPDDTLCFFVKADQGAKNLGQLMSRIKAQYAHKCEDESLVCPPDAFYDGVETILERLKAFRCAYLGLSFDESEMPTLFAEVLDNKDLSMRTGNSPLGTLAEKLPEWRRYYAQIAIAAGSKGDLDRIRAIGRSAGLTFRFVDEPFDVGRACEEREILLYRANLSEGFRSPELALALIGEEELFGEKCYRRNKKKIDEDSLSIASFKELKIGDYIVHTEHGIGRYMGLKTMEIGEITTDFIHIVYAGDDKLYIPVHRLKSVQKYAGAEQPRRLDKLGGGAWERTKAKVRADVKALAIDLLRLYAERLNRPGYAFSEPDEYFRSFEQSFPFGETEDQEKAIEDVLNDMQMSRPMERLICGDVGFGKTEVAFRAAMKAVLDTKQVAILVPTTILAEQHYESCIERFAGFPVRAAVLNRFKTAKQTKQILSDLKNGKIDILIATHRMLSKDVEFKDLGLLIIDEEHRFGVAHKEKIKEMTSTVDCLTMTATPIPRTFQMALGGLKDMSVIATPPVNRISIDTQIAKYNDTLIKYAIESELERNGQIYFLHNRVEELETIAGRLRELVPGLRVVIAHGRMDEKTLEKTMYAFIHHQADLLLCTTIIESGLDIPNANTLLVNRADRFGLAQLYQIRGRVGRSSRKAYCFLLVDSDSMTQNARERLETIEKFTELGSGTQIAYRDLEIRGSGNLLGAKQSGNIESVGLEMYAELMEEALDEIRGREKEKKIDAEVKFPFSAFLPDAYIEDIHLRLLFYKRVSGAPTLKALYDIFGEMQDRFGPLPEEALHLRDTFEIKLKLSQLRIPSLEANHSTVILDLKDSRLDTLKVVEKISSDPKKFRLRNDGKLMRYLSPRESAAFVECVSDFLDDLETLCVPAQ